MHSLGIAPLPNPGQPVAGADGERNDDHRRGWTWPWKQYAWCRWTEMVGVHILRSLMLFSFLHANRPFVAGSCWPVQGAGSTFSAFSCDCCVELITEFAVELFIEFRSGLLVTHLWSHFLTECGWRGWQSHCSLYPAIVNLYWMGWNRTVVCSLQIVNLYWMGCNCTVVCTLQIVNLQWGATVL